MRPIDADALKKWVEEYHTSNWGIPQDELIYAIGSAPTIEPKRGMWEPYEEQLDYGEGYDVWARGFKCSLCGTQMGKEWNFCPNCGARMERSEDEAD